MCVCVCVCQSLESNWPRIREMEIELKKRESALESRMTALLEKEGQLNKRAERLVQVFFF